MHSDNDKDSPNNERNTGEPELSLGEGPEPQHENTQATDEESKHSEIKSKIIKAFKKPSITDWFIAIATIAICATSYLQWQSIHGQLNEMKSQTIAMRGTANTSRVATELAKQSIDAAQKQVQLDQRAWMGVVSVDGQVEAGKKIKAIVHFKNIGKTPARRVQFVITEEELPERGKPDFILNSKSLKRERHKSTMLIAPQQEFTATITGEDVLTDSMLKSLKIGGKKAYVHGLLTYDDIFDRHHWLTYCFFLNINDSRYTAYEKYNDTGTY